MNAPLDCGRLFNSTHCDNVSTRRGISTYAHRQMRFRDARETRQSELPDEPGRNGQDCTTSSNTAPGAA